MTHSTPPAHDLSAAQPAGTAPASGAAGLNPPPLYAAIDLGSNSFHLLLSSYCHGRFVEVCRVKELVQLVRHISPDGHLDPAAIARALQCLQRFRQLLERHPGVTVLAVATKVLRMATPASRFLQQAEAALGAPIRIISAEEEARLVYAGIASYLQEASAPRLVIDVGGASTELVCGRAQSIGHWVSLDLGCVTSANRFFDPGQALTAQQRMEQACAHARLQLREHRPALLQHGWQQAYGAAGTLKVVASLIDPVQPPTALLHGQITHLIQTYTDNNSLPASCHDALRHDVLPAGLAIIDSLFTELQLERIHIAEASIKEGLLQQALSSPE